MNEIEVPEDQIALQDREAANSGDASSIRARQTAPANDADAGEVPQQPEAPVDATTQERMKRIRESDRRKVEELLRTRGGGQKDSEPTDDAVKPAAGTGKPLNPKAPKAGENSIRPKPVTEKTGYEVPGSVRARYVAFDGKFLDRQSETVHFEDKGRSLATASEDRDVIQHMVAVAEAKNWGELQLKGTEEFRRQAWIAAELAGIPTRGFRPDAQDRAKLQSVREAMRITAGERDKHEAAARTNTVEAASDGKKPDQPELARANGAPEKAAPAARAASPGADRATTPAAPDNPAPAPVPSAGPFPAQPGLAAGPAAGPTSTAQQGEATKAAQPAQTPPGVTQGVLVAHGPASFNHDPKQSNNYFATVRTEAGERTVWGLDLERAIGESGVQVGQHIELEKGASRQVSALQRRFDGKGQEVEPKPVTSRRNEWMVFSRDVPGLPTREERQAMASVRSEVDEKRRINEARERFLSGKWEYSNEQRASLELARERIKEQAARQVLEEEIRALPESQKEHLRGEFESVVAAARAANRPLDVPMPQVSEATIEAVREQIERERAAQGMAQAQQPARAGEQDAPQRATQETGHDVPSIELEP